MEKSTHNNAAPKYQTRVYHGPLLQPIKPFSRTRQCSLHSVFVGMIHDGGEQTEPECFSSNRQRHFRASRNHTRCTKMALEEKHSGSACSREKHSGSACSRENTQVLPVHEKNTQVLPVHEHKRFCFCFLWPLLSKLDVVTGPTQRWCTRVSWQIRTWTTLSRSAATATWVWSWACWPAPGARAADVNSWPSPATASPGGCCNTTESQTSSWCSTPQPTTPTRGASGRLLKAPASTGTTCRLPTAAPVRVLCRWCWDGCFCSKTPIAKLFGLERQFRGLFWKTGNLSRFPTQQCRTEVSASNISQNWASPEQLAFSCRSACNIFLWRECSFVSGLQENFPLNRWPWTDKSGQISTFLENLLVFLPRMRRCNSKWAISCRRLVKGVHESVSRSIVKMQFPPHIELGVFLSARFGLPRAYCNDTCLCGCMYVDMLN